MLILRSKPRQYLTHILLLFLVAGCLPWLYHSRHPEMVAFRQAEQAFARGDFKDAAEAYSRAITEGLRSVEVYSKLGDASLAGQDFSRAVEVFRALHQSHPDNPVWTLKLARTLGVTKHYVQALKLLDRLLEQRPEWRPALIARARIRTARGEFHKAINDYKRALKEG